MGAEVESNVLPDAPEVRFRRGDDLVALDLLTSGLLGTTFTAGARRERDDISDSGDEGYDEAEKEEASVAEDSVRFRGLGESLPFLPVVLHFGGVGGAKIRPLRKAILGESAGDDIQSSIGETN